MKWKDLSLRDAEEILEKLKEKAGKVQGKWVGHYCLIAKNIEGKEKLDCLAFDMQDLERVFSGNLQDPSP